MMSHASSSGRAELKRKRVGAGLHREVDSNAAAGRLRDRADGAADPPDAALPDRRAASKDRRRPNVRAGRQAPTEHHAGPRDARAAYDHLRVASYRRR